jgi:hypothetical protein
VRVDPRTGRVVASEELGSGGKVGYGRLVAGGGYVWFGSGDGLARVAPGDPCTRSISGHPGAGTLMLPL